MKSNSLLVLACLVSMPVFAQSLPDEINYGPYETRYNNLSRETAQAQTQLNQSRSSLAEAQRFIREMTSHIAELESNIDDSESEISRLRREIPELERQISNLRSQDSQVMSDLRSKQNEESNLTSRYQQAQRDLRPLEDQLARKQQRLREMQSEIAQLQRSENEAAQRLARAQSQAERIDREHVEARNKIAQMQAELRSIEARVSQVQSQISSAESSLSTLNSNANSERAKLGALNGRVSEYEAEVSRLRSSGAPAEEIAQAERKLNAARNTRDNTASEIRNIEGQISRAETQIRSLRSDIDSLRRDQQALPSRISQAESRMRQLESERAQAQAEISRYAPELQNLRRNIEVRVQQANAQQQDIRTDEQDVMRQRQFIENVGRQIETVRSEIANLNSRSRDLNQQIARASEQARADAAAIPRLEQSIRDDQAEIAEGQRDLGTARTDERTFTAAVQRDEAKLSQVTSQRDSAQGEFNQRLGLYNRYLDESESIGANQAGAGTTLGEKEGQRLSGVLSKQNGVAVGRELGTAEAKHWGSVRGEFQGYDLGYSEGIASQEDISRAISEASAKAAADAELYAQRNFKPVFFEEFVLAEFKKPLGTMSLTPKSLKGLHVSFAMEAAMETVSPLSPNEIARSEELKTPLDASILEAAKSVKSIEGKVKRLADPEVAFETPTKIPTGTANCAQVYKGLAVFKAACEGSYKGTFANNYVNAARESFGGLYTSQFTSEFNSANVSQREASFSGELAAASKIGRAEGLRVGKIEIYNRTYSSTYKTAYDSELEKARAKAKVDAGNELSGFLKGHALLTVANTILTAENFRGGEDVILNGMVKNVGAVALNGPVLVRITEVVNAEKVTGEAVLNAAAPLSLTSLPQLKVKVAASAKAGDRMIVRGTVDLPGDMYKPARQEKFELNQILTANPAHDLNLNFNKTPDIKGVFRRNIHFFTVTVAPKVEEIKEGYQMTLTPVGEASSVMEMREGVLDTGAMKVGTSKDIRFSYVFKDAAKAKNLVLELAISYAGKVIKKESVTLVPR
jgi:predicted  nucleic acid-binding Zn-ribbon protein